MTNPSQLPLRWRAPRFSVRPKSCIPARRPTETLDLAEAIDRREKVLRYMGREYAGWVELARDVALEIAGQRGTVTADDVRAVLYAADLRPRHHNAWGAVFRCKDFAWTGEYRRSAVPRGKGNMQRVWRVKT